MFDTHCHLNFSIFNKTLSEVIAQAKKTGIDQILIPGTDISSSLKAIEIANQNQGVFAAVAIHPHHVQEFRMVNEFKIEEKIQDVEKLLLNPKVVAIGEVGLDKHMYKNTKYKTYTVDES